MHHMLLSQNWLVPAFGECRLIACPMFASLFVSALMATLLSSPDKCFRSQRAMVLNEKEGQQVSCPPVFPSIQGCREAEQTLNSGLTSAPGWFTTPMNCFLIEWLAKDSNPCLLNCEIPKREDQILDGKGSCGGAVEHRCH